MKRVPYSMKGDCSGSSLPKLSIFYSTPAYESFFSFISWFWTPFFTTFLSSPELDDGFASWGMSPQHTQDTADHFPLAPQTSGHQDKYPVPTSAWITWAALLPGLQVRSPQTVLGDCTNFAKFCTWKGTSTINKKNTLQKHSQSCISTQRGKKKECLTCCQPQIVDSTISYLGQSSDVFVITFKAILWTFWISLSK